MWVRTPPRAHKAASAHTRIDRISGQRARFSRTMRRRRRGIQACRGPIYSGSTPTLASKTSLGDFDKCCKMRIYVQKSASIQLRTGSLKELLPRPPHALGRQRLYSFQCQRHRGFPPFQPSAQPLSRGLHPASPPRPRQPGAPRACRLSAVCGPT